MVSESHKVLDNSFLSSQAHLTNHVASLSYDACLDMVVAMEVYREYLAAVQELVEAEGRTCEALVGRGEELARQAEAVFKRVEEIAYLESSSEEEGETRLNTY